MTGLLFVNGNYTAHPLLQATSGESHSFVYGVCCLSMSIFPAIASNYISYSVLLTFILCPVEVWFVNVSKILSKLEKTFMIGLTSTLYSALSVVQLVPIVWSAWQTMLADCNYSPKSAAKLEILCRTVEDGECTLLCAF